MNRYFVFFSLIFLCVSSIQAQTSPHVRGAEVDPIQKETEKYRIITGDDLLIQNTYISLEKSLLNKELAAADVFTAADVKSYVDRYSEHPEVIKNVEYEAALINISSIVQGASAKLKLIGSAQNVTLMGSKTFYADEFQISKVIQHRVDIVDEKGKAVLYDVLFMDIDGTYKIFAINDEF